MKTSSLSTRKILLISSAGAVLTAVSLIIVMYVITGSSIIIYGGMLLTGVLLLWGAVFISLLQRKLLDFTSNLCRTLDAMMNGNEKPEVNLEEESLLARISHRLDRLYHTLQENRRSLEVEKLELQTLVSDISHQTKTPIANLKMINDTLLVRSMTEEKEKEFLTAAGGQLDKLDFMIQALVKTSRLETGLILLEKKPSPIYETLVAAINGVLALMENKKIELVMECPQELCASCDSRWTAEALFNLLDNAVKYTSVGGSICISVQVWEMHVKIDISDTGKGIPENEQAAIFKRFYREASVQEIDGIGIGLYLAREIVTRQGGYIKVTSEVGQGSTFSVFLPR